MAEFTQAEIDAATAEAGSLDAGLALLWRRKAADYSVLVDIQEGSSSRKMSQLYSNAMDQAKYYDARAADAASGSATGGMRAGRTRAIVRP